MRHSWCAGMAAAALVAAAAGAPRAGPPGDAAPHTVATARVEVRVASRALPFSGVTRARKRAVLSFPVAGRLVDRPVELGARVRSGDVLARLDPTPLENAVVEADAALYDARVRWRQARRDRERTEKLQRVGGRTLRDLEDAEASEAAARAQVAAAQSRLAEAERQLDQAWLRAPFDATVSAVHVDPSEFAAAGAPVVALAGDGALEVEIQVPQELLGGLRVGQALRVEFPLAPGVSAAARVHSLTHASAAPGGLFPVVVELPPAAPLRAGMSAVVRVDDRSDASLLVPADAIVAAAGRESSVFRLERDRAQSVPVEVLALAGDWVVVRGPLREGDEVVVAGHASLLDGEPVRVAEPAAPQRP